MSPRQRFLNHLLLDDIQATPCACPVCKPVNINDAFDAACKREFRFRELVAQHRLLADRQRIVEVFPTTHRRVSVGSVRQRIVEIGGGGE